MDIECKNYLAQRSRRDNRFNVAQKFSILFVILSLAGCFNEKKSEANYLDEIEQRINLLGKRSDPISHVCTAVLLAALDAAMKGNYGIGACLWDKKNSKIITCGQNKVFYPYFRSDMHAEMDVINKHENNVKKSMSSIDGITLITSLEPCPMCLTRTITAGLDDVQYMVPDDLGGMVSRIDSMPPIWKQLMKGKKYKEASCSDEHKKIAYDLFHKSRSYLDAKLEQK